MTGELPTQRQLAEFDHGLRGARALHYRLKDLIKCLPATGHPMDALQSTVAALGAFYPCRTVSDPVKNWDACIRLTAALPTLVAAFARTRRGEEILDPRDDLDHAANFYYMTFGREPTPAIRKVLGGNIHLSEALSATLLARYMRGGQGVPPASPMEALSDRELEVFRMLGQGKGVRQIAEELKLTIPTVNSFRNRIKEKLALKSSTEVMLHAIQWLRETATA